MARPLAEAAARNSGLMPIASDEVGAGGMLVALEIAGLALPVALLWSVSVCVNTKSFECTHRLAVVVVADAGRADVVVRGRVIGSLNLGGIISLWVISMKFLVE